MKSGNLTAGLAAMATALVLALPWVASPASAADVRIRFGWATTDAETDAYRYAAHVFADALEREAPGRFQVSFFPNRQLGDEKEMVQGMQLGTVDVALITNSIVANVEPAFQINDLPFLYDSPEQAHRILDSELGGKLFERLSKKNIVGLAFCESGFRNMVNNVRPVTAPKDLEGVKYRVMESPLFIGMYQNLGGTAVPMAWGDTFTALQQGTIDGLELPTWVIHASKVYEASKYLSLTQHVYTATPMMMSARSFNKLGKDDQQLVGKAAAHACKEQRVFNAGLEAKNLEDLKAKGMEINRLGGTAGFRERMKPLYDSYRPKIGDELVQAWMAALAK